MKKTNTRLFITFVLILVFAAIFAVAAFAATPGTGYCVNAQKQQTNIKWTMTEDGVLTFEIDPTATDKVQETALYGVDPITLKTSNWSRCLETFADAVKVVIGDGITTAAGFSAMTSLKQVEIPTSLVNISGAAFECSHGISSIYIRGTEPVEGLFDFSNITSFGGYCCDGAEKLTKVKLNPNYVGPFEIEIFKNNKLTEIEIPAGVTVIQNGAFMKTNQLAVVTILGMETTFESAGAFMGNMTYPAIRANANSKAAAFAKANGFTFIDIDTGEKTPGVRLTTEASTGDSSDGTTSDGLPEFKHEGATLWGHSTGEYSGTEIINTYWAYYDETKTLEFVSGTKEYNESGTIKNVDEEYTDWIQYKSQIEHIIIGDYIVKISATAFQNYPALKDVRLGKHVSQIDYHAFLNCSDLTTIWRNGQQRVEGRADLRGLSPLNPIIGGTAIKEIILPENVTKIASFPPSAQTVFVSTITESLVQSAKENFVDIINLYNPEEKYEFSLNVDYTLPYCGPRSVFDFDEATGTLTVYGTGKISDIVNYYGGGSKTQPWISIRNNVKHIVITDHITSIGRYAFCEFVNLETVQIPASEDFEILNAAFEKCHSLKSIYRSGTEPIEGTADLRNVHTINPWTLAYDWLIANVIISPNVEKIGSSVFEENINLANIYGTPGSFAETYAADNGKNFYDISSNTPVAITCAPPETTVMTETEAPETTETEPEETTVLETETDVVSDTFPVFVDKGEVQNSSSVLAIIIVAIVVVVVAAAVVVVIIVSKKKKAKK